MTVRAAVSFSILFPSLIERNVVHTKIADATMVQDGFLEFLR